MADGLGELLAPLAEGIWELVSSVYSRWSRQRDERRPRPPAGTRFRARRRVVVDGCVVLVTLSGRATKFRAALHEGIVVCVSGSDALGTGPVLVIPEDEAAGEMALVSKEDRSDPRYDGYFLMIPLPTLEKHFERLPRAA